MPARQRKHLARRTRKGSTVVEFVLMGWLLALVALLGLNCGVMVMAAWANDAACRDAVRAAAEQDTASKALAAARAATARFATSSLWMTSPTVSVQGEDFAYRAFRDANGVPQRSQGPCVTVATVTTAVMPAPLFFNGAALTDKITFKQNYTFPLMRLSTIPGEDPDNITIAPSEDPEDGIGDSDDEVAAEDEDDTTPVASGGSPL